MSDLSPKFEIKLNFPLFLGLSFLVHFSLFLLTFNTAPSKDGEDSRRPMIVTIGEKVKSDTNILVKQELPKAQRIPRKDLSLRDLTAGQSSGKVSAPSSRPGQLPQRPNALSNIRYGSDDFKRMASDPMVAGGDILTSNKIALNFEVPEGKKVDELNQSQLRLYSFLRRGAIKYVNSLSSEIKDFELQNPHLQFPMVDTKQVLTGRLVYDNEGNLKQIKMVRWSNNDKLQGFFENVLKRLENLQNPPKELWVESGEFVVFVTLQING